MEIWELHSIELVTILATQMFNGSQLINRFFNGRMDLWVVESRYKGRGKLANRE